MDQNKKDTIIAKISDFAYEMEDDTVDQYLLIIESYKDRELQKMFLEKNEISIFLEDFLARCFRVNLYMNSLNTNDIMCISDMLTGDVGSYLFELLFGYYGWMSEMANYFKELGISCLSKDYYDSAVTTIHLSKVMRTNLFNLNIKDDVYNVLMGNFVDCFTAELENLLEDFLNSCYCAAEDGNMYDLERDFINYNENRLDILSTNNRIYDNIMNKILNRVENISDSLSDEKIHIIMKNIFDYRLSVEDLEQRQNKLIKVLEREVI